MKKGALLLFSMSLLLIACSSEPEATDRDKMRLTNDVKSVFTLTYKAIDKFGEGNIVRGELNNENISYVAYNPEGYILSQRNYIIYKSNKKYYSQYDDKDLMKLWISYEDDGTTEKYKKAYEYDEKANVIVDYDLKDHSKSNYTYKYDSDRVISKTDRYSVTTYKYDLKGNIIEEKEVSKIGLNTRMNTYEYDDNGNRMLLKAWYIPSDKRYSMSIIYKYDSYNRMIDQIGFSTLDQKESSIEYRRKYFFKDSVARFPHRYIEWDAKGEIKEESYSFCLYDDGKLITQFDLNKDHEIEYLNLQNYTGKEYESTYYNIKSSVYFAKENVYEAGKLISSKCNDESMSLIYDGNRLTKSVIVNDDNREEKLYDKKGKLTQTTVYDKSNKIVAQTTYNYNGNSKNGTMTIVNIMPKSKEEFKSENIIKDGFLIESNQIENGIQQKIVCAYDENGLLISEKNVTKGEEKTFDYQIDPKGNWYRQITYLNGQPICIAERIIEYF